MVARMSNKDRIAKLAAEKAAGDKEKAEKKKKVSSKKAPAKRKARTTRSRAAAKGAARLKAVWAVCDQSGSTVKTFGFGEKTAATKEAKKLTEDKSKQHFVKMDKVPME